MTNRPQFTQQTSIETSIEIFLKKLKTCEPLKKLVAGIGFEPMTFGL